MLLDLPTELLEKLLLHLDVKDSISCQSVNATLRHSLQNSVELQYHAALQRSGNLDNPQCQLSTSKKLQMLERSEYWWSSEAIIGPVLETSWQTHDDSLRVTKLLGFTDRFLLYGARWEDRDETKLTHLVWEPHPSDIESFIDWQENGPPVNSWIVNPPPELKDPYIIGLTTDLDRNGIIAVLYAQPDKESGTVTIFLVLMEEATASKPDAMRWMRAVCTFGSSSVPMQAGLRYDANVELSGENLAIMFQLSNFEGGLPPLYILSVVDWLEGRLKAHISDTKTPGLAFLTPEFILVPSSPSSSIRVYHIQPSSTRRARSDGPAPPQVSHVASFQLPKLASDSITYNGIDIQSSPNPISEDTMPFSAMAGHENEAMRSQACDARDKAFPRRPYYTDPMQAIIAMTLTFRIGMPDDMSGYAMSRLFIHRRALLDVFLPLWKANLESESQDLIQIPWEDWGPKWSRWIPVREPSPLNRSNEPRFWVYGERCIDMVPISQRNTETYAAVNQSLISKGALLKKVADLYDFNPNTCKILRQNQQAFTEEENNEVDGEHHRFAHSGIRIGIDHKSPAPQSQMPYQLVGGPDEDNKFYFGGAVVFKPRSEEDLEGSVVGMLPCVQYEIPGLPGVGDIAIDGRRVIQRELHSTVDTTTLHLYFA